MLRAIPQNEKIIYQEVTFQAIIEAGAMSFMVIFLVRLGSPNWLVGLYTSLPALVAIFVALPIGAFVQSNKSLVATANWSRLVFRGTIGLFALLPWLGAGIAPYVLVGARTLLEVPAEAANIAFTTILGTVTPPRSRPRMLSTRLAVNGLMAAVMGFLTGQWLDWAPYPLNYQLLFLSAFVAGLFSIYTLSLLRLPEAPRRQDGKTGHVGLGQIPDLIKQAPAFRNFCAAAFLFRMGLSMPSALYAIYRVRNLGASDAWIGTMLTVERALSVLSFFLLARFLTREKYRRWLWLSCIGIALYPLTMSLARTPEMLLIPHLCGGIFGAGMNVFLSDTLFAVTPEDRRPPYVATNACLASVANFLAPMLGTILGELVGINVALFIIAGVRVAGGLSFWMLGVGREMRAR